MNSEMNSSSIAIHCHEVSKNYFFYRNPLSKLWDITIGKMGAAGQEYPALQNITFGVHKGESIALVGHNGSGKSTLLKLIAGVARPSEGSLTTNGRIAALLELGTGFHGEFTGRQNLLMNARMNGLNDEEIESRMEAIIAFSELGEFIDRKVRTYSSGMLLRLGFSLATHVDADILLVDEALAVGDAYFQSKCIKRIQNLVHNEGKTLLYVSHDPSSVKLICTRAILLSKGKMLGDGAPDTVLDHYNALSARENKLDEDSLINAYNGRGGIVSGEHTFKIQRAVLLDSEGNDRVSFLSGERAKLLCTFCHEGSEEISGLTMGMHIRDARGYEIFGTNTFHTQFKMGTVSPHSPITLAFDFPLNIGRGRYTIGLAFHSGREHTAKNYKWMDKAIVFEVADDHRYVFDGVARLVGHFTRVE